MRGVSGQDTDRWRRLVGKRANAAEQMGWTDITQRSSALFQQLPTNGMAIPGYLTNLDLFQ